jgi:hypothetical protein
MAYNRTSGYYNLYQQRQPRVPQWYEDPANLTLGHCVARLAPHAYPGFAMSESGSRLLKKGYGPTQRLGTIPAIAWYYRQDYRWDGPLETIVCDLNDALSPALDEARLLQTIYTVVDLADRVTSQLYGLGLDAIRAILWHLITDADQPRRLDYLAEPSTHESFLDSTIRLLPTRPNDTDELESGNECSQLVQDRVDLIQEYMPYFDEIDNECGRLRGLGEGAQGAPGEDGPDAKAIQRMKALFGNIPKAPMRAVFYTTLFLSNSKGKHNCQDTAPKMVRFLVLLRIFYTRIFSKWSNEGQMRAHKARPRVPTRVCDMTPQQSLAKSVSLGGTPDVFCAPCGTQTPLRSSQVLFMGYHRCNAKTLGACACGDPRTHSSLFAASQYTAIAEGGRGAREDISRTIRQYYDNNRSRFHEVGRYSPEQVDAMIELL